MDTGAPAADPIGLDPEVRHGVDWATYCRLRDDPANDRVRMTYLDGTLIMSPRYRHDSRSRRIYDIVRAVAVAWRIRFLVTGATTLRLEGRGPLGPVGKEPDEGFYLGDEVAAMVDEDDLDLSVVPPPSLVIEVDNTADSEAALPIYARIGVPEVWIYKVGDPSLRFLQLADGRYQEIGRSLGLPRLTPSLVLEALEGRAKGMDDLEFSDWLDAWARALPEPPL